MYQTRTFFNNKLSLNLEANRIPHLTWKKMAKSNGKDENIVRAPDFMNLWYAVKDQVTEAKEIITQRICFEILDCGSSVGVMDNIERMGTSPRDTCKNGILYSNFYRVWCNYNCFKCHQKLYSIMISKINFSKVRLPL